MKTKKEGAGTQNAIKPEKDFNPFFILSKTSKKLEAGILF